MKIQLLLELIQTTQSSKQFHGKFGGKKRENHNRWKKGLGGGTQASVKDHPHDPHLVKKHNVKAYPDDNGKLTDGFNSFVNYLIEHDLMDNVHFPKVYDIKEIVDKNGRKIYTYDMEKLVKSEDLSREELEAFCERTFIPETVIEFLDDAATAPTRGDHEPYRLRLLDKFTNVFDSALNYGNVADLQDESLKFAFEIIHQIATHLQKNSDLHHSNYMWRRSSTGVQIVITDPFW